jgi:hypothetical protein
MVNTDCVDVELIRIFIMFVLPVLPFVLGDLARSLHPLLVDRNEFILLDVTENFGGCKHYAVSVRQGK